MFGSVHCALLLSVNVGVKDKSSQIVTWHQNFKFPFTQLIHFVAIDQIYVNWILKKFLAFQQMPLFLREERAK